MINEIDMLHERHSADQVWEILLTLVMQTIKKDILAIKSERLGGYAKSNDFKVGKLGNNTTTWYVSEFATAASSESTTSKYFFDIPLKIRNFAV